MRVVEGRRSAPPTVERGVLTELRTALENADFTVERIETTLGVAELSAVPGVNAVHRRRLAGADPFSVIDRLFVLGDTLEVSPVEVALRPLTLDRLAPLGLFRSEDEGIRATVRLLPHGDYYLASDPVTVEPPSDWVAGIHAPSITLAKLAVRRPVEAALDLGTGCGIKALAGGEALRASGCHGPERTGARVRRLQRRPQRQGRRRAPTRQPVRAG